MAAFSRSGLATLLVVSCLSVAAMAAATDPAQQKTGAPPADQDFAALLQHTEQLIESGHTLAPPNDNALSTWGQVLTRASPPSPEVRQALADFIADLHARAATDEAAHNAVLASDLSVFADQANEILKQGGGPVPVSARVGQAPPRPVRPTVQEEPLPAPASQGIDASTAETYTRRGDAMLALKDISAARKFYAYAAAAGSARAAMALGRTYDPAYATELDIVGLQPDAAVATEWYRKAAAMGDVQAKSKVGLVDSSASR